MPWRGGATTSGIDFALALIGATPIRAVHIMELRARIDALLASPFPWTDDPIIPRTTEVRWIHFSELRMALDQAYAARGEEPPPYTPGGAGTPVRAIHVTELSLHVIALEVS